MSPVSDFLKRERWSLIATAICLVIGIAAFLSKPPPSDSLNVPLGVEQAAIVTYSGPPIAVTPYKWGVAVNVRIAGVTERPGVRIYDVRYIVNRGGDFNLKDYLGGADGKPLEGLPSFKFHGDPKLSQELDTRIQETEKVRVDVGGHYHAVLTGLAVFWIIWLLLLIFYKRPHAAAAAAPPPPEPTLTELLRAALAQLQSGSLDAAGKAKLEMMLLRRWRETLALPDQPMIATHDAIARHQQTGKLLRQVQHFLHHPASPVKGAEIASALAPFAAEARAPQP